MNIKSVIFDVCGVLGDARGKVPWKAKVAMEEANLCEKYGIGLIEILKAYSKGGFDPLWEEYKVGDPEQNQYFTAWDGIPEYPPGSVLIYPEVPFVFNKLLNAGINIVICTRLTNENVTNVLNEIKKRGFKGQIEHDIKVFNPKNDDVRKDDDSFIEEVLKFAFDDTKKPMIYIDDGLARTVHFKTWDNGDNNIFIIGSSRGFYNVKELQTMYYNQYLAK